MWEFCSGVAVGLASGFAASFLEPVQRWFARMGRTSAADAGIQMHVELDPAVIWAGMPDWIGFHYYIPELDPGEAPPENPREWRGWASRHGGWDLGTSIARLTLVGTAPVTVVLETPEVTVSEEPLPEGTKIFHPVGGATISPTAFNVDLDTFSSDHPIVHISAEGGETARGPLSWSLQKNEVEQILIRVSSARPSLIHWEARLPLLIDGERRFLEINDHTAPITFAGGALFDEWNHWDGTNWVAWT